MEITYRLSEAEYVKAWRLRMKGGRRLRLIKVILFWSFILICLILLWAIVQKNSKIDEANRDDPQTASTDYETQVSRASITKSLAVNVAPFLLLACLWIFLLIRLGPMRLRQMYRRDPLMQGLFTVSLTPGAIVVQNTAGLSSQFGWNLFEFWREGNDLIIAVYFSSAYFTLSLAGLSEPQRAELRGILAAALPRK